MDGYLKKNLDECKKIIKDDWDMVFAVDGYEGTGKSVLAQQCAKFVDESFNIDRICFTPKHFVEAINKSEKYQAIVYDEAYGGMSSRAAMSEVNRSLMSVLAEIRQKNLFVFIVLPCFFELDKYAAVWRSRALIHVYTAEGFQRGRFSFYNQDRKKNLYVLGKKFFSYYKPSPNFFGRFTAGYTVPEEEYRKKKLEALKVREEVKVSARELKWKSHAMKLRKILVDDYKWTDVMLANALEVSKPTMSLWKKEQTMKDDANNAYMPKNPRNNRLKVPIIGYNIPKSQKSPNI